MKEFKCQRCGKTQLEEVCINATYSVPIKDVDEEETITYGKPIINEAEHLIFQCINCGKSISDEEFYDLA